MGTHDVGARGWSVPARLAVMMFLQYFASEPGSFR